MNAFILGLIFFLIVIFGVVWICWKIRWIAHIVGFLIGLIIIVAMIYAFVWRSYESLWVGHIAGLIVGGIGLLGVFWFGCEIIWKWMRKRRQRKEKV